MTETALHRVGWGVWRGGMADIRLDTQNANKGTVRGRGMIERSLSHYGAGRSILVSADDVALGGNKTLEVARELGIPVKVVESDGRTLIAVKRTDLPYDDPRARELAIADNRSSETGLEWDADVLQGFLDEGLDLDQFWFPEELDRIFGTNDGFLDDALSAGDGHSPWPGGDDEGDPNTMPLRVTPEERGRIMAAVRLAKQHFPGIESTPAAIAAICEDWRCQRES